MRLGQFREARQLGDDDPEQVSRVRAVSDAT